MNRRQEILLLERLWQEVYGPRLHRPRGHRNVTVSGDEDDRNPYAGLHELVLKLESANSRKPHIEYQATRGLRPLCFQEFQRGPENFRMQPH